MEPRAIRNYGLSACCLSVLLTFFSAPGCGSVNTLSSRQTPGEDSIEPLRLKINDVLSVIFLHAKEVRMFRTPGGPQELQVDVTNESWSQTAFAYRFVWLSPGGNVVPSQMSVWKTASIPSGGATTIRSIAPNDTASDFRLEVRESD